MKSFISLFLLCSTISSFSQVDRPTTKGNFTLGGSIGFGFEKNEYKEQSSSTLNESKSSSWYFNPAVGYFVMDGLVLGISPSFSSTESEYGDYINNYQSIGIAPSIKYYFENCFFIGFEYGYSYSKNRYEYKDGSGRVNYSYNSMYANPKLGYAIFINPKVSLEPLIVYSYSEGNRAREDRIYSDFKNHQIYFGVGLQVFL